MKTNFRDLGAGRKKPVPIEVKTSKGIVDFVPTFNENDQVTVIPKHIKSKELQSMKDNIYLVDYCKVSDLGDMVVEVLYLKPSGGTSNPYLVEHFKLLAE